MPALMILKKISKYTKVKIKYFKCCLYAWVLVYIYYFVGVYDFIHSNIFEDDFNYPLNKNIPSIVVDILLGKDISVTPINMYLYNFITNSDKCSTVQNLDLIIAVKSAMDHFGHRNAIRQTYGQENIPGITVRTLFFLGIDGKRESNLQNQIDQEIEKFNDIIQIDFIDNYLNSTIKTMMSFSWMYRDCSTADYYLFTDDDMYISVNNLVNYVHDLEETRISEPKTSEEYSSSKKDLNDDHLFAGYVMSPPKRSWLSKSKVTQDEYKSLNLPAYIAGGAYVVSNRSMKVLYLGSLFVKHFRFDDIYLGIVAKKVNITLTHCLNFYYFKKEYSKENYKYVIASHGYDNHEELIRVWNEQNNAKII